MSFTSLKELVELYEKNNIGPVMAGPSSSHTAGAVIHRVDLFS